MGWTDLDKIQTTLDDEMSRESVMRNTLSKYKDKYDYILIDYMPSLGMITINVLACADKVIIPVQTQFLAAKGMGQFLQTISRVRKQINPNLMVDGVLLTLVDKRTTLSNQVRYELQENYGSKVKIYNTQIPMAVNVAKSTSHGESIFSYDKNSKVAYIDPESGILCSKIDTNMELPKGKKVLAPKICTKCGTTEWKTIDNQM